MRIANLISLLGVLSLFVFSKALSQCATGVGPSYPSGCTSQYFTAVTASGVGVVSTIGYVGGGCAGTFFDNFSSQGSIAPTGSTVNINISRLSSYQAYLAVYVDWNNNNTYETTELVGTLQNLAVGIGSSVYSFTIPLTGIVTNTNLHMRIFLGEPPTASGPISSISPPCSAKWGQSNDYYLRATCATPTIAVAPAAPTICAGGSVLLTASGAGSTPTYAWSPATGLSATTGASVTSTPASTSTYTVTGYGPCVCVATNTVSVTISPAPVPVITAGGPVTFCPGDNVVLSETSGTGTTYQWYNGLVAITGTTNSSYTASVTATYSVSVTNAAGCTAGTTATVTVLAPPVATISPAGGAIVCFPNTVTMSTTASPGYTSTWFNSSGVITGAVSQTYTASATNSYSVEVTDPAGCKDTSVAITITINPKPTASATASGPLTFCAYNSVVLTEAGSPGYTYQWLDGTTPITGATNISYTANTPGTHDYRVEVTNSSGCKDTTDSGLFPVVVYPSPVSTISASGPLSFCAGSNVTLSVPMIAGYTYQWYYGTTTSSWSPIAGAITSSYTANVTGYYYVKITTPFGCTTNSPLAPAQVTVVSLPYLTHINPLNFCWGSHVTLFASVGTAPGITFQWKLNGVNIPAANADTFNAIASGLYACEINVSGSCVSTTGPLTVDVRPLPNPAITYVGSKLKTGNFYAGYQWYRNLVAIPDATTYYTTPNITGTYGVIVVDTYGCVSAAATYPLTLLHLEAGYVNGRDLPVIYPNPASDRVYVQYSKNVKISIADVDGRVLLEMPSAKEIDIRSLSQGIYIIALYDEDNRRILVEKLIRQ
jgi:hypothetical protein